MDTLDKLDIFSRDSLEVLRKEKQSDISGGKNKKGEISAMQILITSKRKQNNRRGIKQQDKSKSFRAARARFIKKTT